MALKMQQESVSKSTNPGKQEQGKAPQFTFQIEGSKQNKQLYKASIFLLLECMLSTGMAKDYREQKINFFKEKYAEVTKVAGKVIVISNGPTILSKTVAMHHKNLLNGNGLTAKGKTLCDAIIEDWKATFSPIYQDNFMDWDESSKLENEKIGTILDDIISSEIADESTALSHSVNVYLSQDFVNKKMSCLGEQRGKLKQLQLIQLQLIQLQQQQQELQQQQIQLIQLQQQQQELQQQLEQLEPLTRNLVDQQYALDPMTDFDEVERTAKEYLTLELQTFARWCFKWPENNVFMCYDHNKFQMAILAALHGFLNSEKFNNLFKSKLKVSSIPFESAPELKPAQPCRINHTRRKNNNVVPFDRRKKIPAPQTTNGSPAPQKNGSPDSSAQKQQSFAQVAVGSLWCTVFQEHKKAGAEATQQSTEWIKRATQQGLGVIEERYSPPSSEEDEHFADESSQRRNSK